jgi:energy-converting hydrogenase Eha subunit A
MVIAIYILLLLLITLANSVVCALCLGEPDTKKMIAVASSTCAGYLISKLDRILSWGGF